MNILRISIITMLVLGAFQIAYAQSEKIDMVLVVTDEEKIIIFGSFAAVVIGIFLFLARDIILRRKTAYDRKEFESKKENTYEKYHSDWGDDYEELGKRRNTKDDQEFREAVSKNSLINYYDVIGVSNSATPEEIKNKFRELAKKIHPDKTKVNSEEEMAELNKAYEVLSDKERRASYDRYFKVS